MFYEQPTNPQRLSTIKKSEAYKYETIMEGVEKRQRL